MGTQLGKYSVFQRITPLVKGFDTVLGFAVLLLAVVGLLTIYSSGYSEGQRFLDHGRNMLIACIIMFVVAQIPPQRMMSLAVPIYTVGLALLVAVALFGLTRKGAQRWLNVGIVIQPSEIMKIGMPLMLAWWFQKREGQLRTLDFFVGGLILLYSCGSDRQATRFRHSHLGHGSRLVCDFSRWPELVADHSAIGFRYCRYCFDCDFRAQLMCQRDGLAFFEGLPTAAGMYLVGSWARSLWVRVFTPYKA
jgi:hypothetical protein